MILTKDKGQRMWGGGGFGGSRTGGSSGGGGGSVAGLASEAWVEEGYLSKDFFSKMFTINGANAVIIPNDVDSTPQNIQALYNVRLDQNLYFENNKSLQFKDSSGTYRNVLTMNTLNALAIGYHTRQQGYTTDIQGDPITFATNNGQTSDSRLEVGEFSEAGRFWVKQGTQGIRIGDGLITWDATNNALKVSAYNGGAASIYALGGVSALGYTAGGGGGGAAALTDLADVTITSPTSGQILVYDGTGHWQNVTANYLSKTGGSMTGNIDFGAERGLIFDIDSSIRTGSDNYLHINAYEELVLEVDNHEWLTINTNGDLRQNDNYESGAYAKLFFDSTGYNIGVYGTSTRNSIYLVNDVYCSANVEVTDDLTVYGDIHGEKFYLDNTHYIYLDNGTLKYYDNGTVRTFALSL